MTRRFLAVPVLAAVAVCAGCGSDAQQSINGWADKVCVVLAGPQRPQYLEAVAAMAHPPANVAPAAVKTQIATGLGMAAGYDNAVADALGSAGTPDAQNAAALISQAQVNLRNAATALSAEEAKVDALPIANQTQFAQALNGISGDLAQTATQSAAAVNSLGTGPLGQALEKSPACVAITAQPSGGASASGTPGPMTGPAAPATPSTAATPGGVPPGTATPGAPVPPPPTTSPTVPPPPPPSPTPTFTLPSASASG